MYDIEIMEENFEIELEHEQKILDAIKKSDLPSELKRGTSLEEIFANFGFCLELFDDMFESISQMLNRTETDESFQKLLFIIAPWVKHGSYIQCMGNGANDVWQWVFEDKTLFYCRGFISFRKMEKIVVDGPW